MRLLGVLLLGFCMIQLADRQAMEAELARRERVRAAMIEPQIAAANDTSMLRSVQCDRRAGKTSWAILDWADDGQRHNDYESAYIALTRLSAERIAWPILTAFNRELRLGLHLREAKLRAILPSGSALTLYGADRPDWMPRLYGQKLRKIYIDEAAFFSIDLKHLIDDILEPTVADLEGQITLMSRPGFFNRGFFYKVCHGKVPGWSHHKWSWRDNKHIRKQVERLIARKKATNPDLESDPAHRRNWMNEWVRTAGKLCYGTFDPERNGIAGSKLPDFKKEGHWKFVLGLDIGWFDKTAFSIVAWSQKSPILYELESYGQSQMEIKHMVSRIRMYRDYYPGLRIVGDPDRREAWEELRRRTGLPLIPAEKVDKRHWIGLINDDYSDRKILLADAESSTHAEEMADLDWVVRPNGKEIENPERANDECDAFQYAYRACWHWRYEAEETQPEFGSKKWYEVEAKKLEQEMEKQWDQEREW